MAAFWFSSSNDFSTATSPGSATTPVASPARTFCDPSAQCRLNVRRKLIRACRVGMVTARAIAEGASANVVTPRSCTSRKPVTDELQSCRPTQQQKSTLGGGDMGLRTKNPSKTCSDSELAAANCLSKAAPVAAFTNSVW